MGSSCIRGWTNVSCFGRQILYHWASREDLTELFYNRLSLDSPWFLHRNPQTHIAYEGTELLLRFPIFPSSPSCISGDCLLKLTLHSNLGTTSYFEFCIFQSNERYSSPVVIHPIPNLLFNCSNYLKKKSKTNFKRISLVVQWMGVHLPMQGTRVQSLVWEGSTCPGATEPGHHNYGDLL